MFLYRFTELSVEPEKPRFLWDRDSARSAKRIRWVTRSDAPFPVGVIGAPWRTINKKQIFPRWCAEVRPIALFSAARFV